MVGTHKSVWQDCRISIQKAIVLLKNKVKVLVAQLCLTLCNPMDYSPPGSPIHGMFQARVLEWDAIAFSEGILEYREFIENKGLM